MANISLCMIVKNEEKYLQICLESVKTIIDEIIIVDTGSTDNTKEIAKRYGAKVFDFTWCNDFSKAKNFALQKTTKEWILSLDADETISETDLQKIKRFTDNKLGTAAFELEQRSYVKTAFKGCIKNDSCDPKISIYPAYISNKIIRLFKNNMGIEFRGIIHELVDMIVAEKKIKKEFSGIIIHHFGSLKEEKFLRQKKEEYTLLVKKQAIETPEDKRANFLAGKHYLDEKEYDLALDHFLKTEKIDNAYKLIESEIAKTYVLMGNIEKAIEYYEKSLNINKETPSPSNNLAILFMKKGETQKAKKILEEAMKKFPETKQLIYNYKVCIKHEKNSNKQQSHNKTKN